MSFDSCLILINEIMRTLVDKQLFTPEDTAKITNTVAQYYDKSFGQYVLDKQREDKDSSKR